MPDVYLTYDRDFDQGKNCIVERDCLSATGSVFTVADWGILGEVTAQRNIEFRWVELEMIGLSSNDGGSQNLLRVPN